MKQRDNKNNNVGYIVVKKEASKGIQKAHIVILPYAEEEYKSVLDKSRIALQVYEMNQSKPVWGSAQISKRAKRRKNYCKKGTQ